MRRVKGRVELLAYGTRPSTSLAYSRVSFFSSLVSAAVGGGSLVAHPMISKESKRARVPAGRLITKILQHPSLRSLEKNLLESPLSRLIKFGAASKPLIVPDFQTSIRIWPTV
jgi:hypothetical protein